MDNTNPANPSPSVAATACSTPFASKHGSLADLTKLQLEHNRRGSDGDTLVLSLEKDGEQPHDRERRRGSDGETLVLSAEPSDEEKAAGTQSDDSDTSPPPTDEPAHGRLLPLGRFVLVYACLGLSIFLTSIDQTIVACILPNISSQFGAQDAPWVGVAFLLMQTTFSPCYGRMSDVFGRKPLLLVAIAIFAVGTALCGAAPSVRVLIFARAVAGIGGAGLLSMVHICISDIVTLRKRGLYHGILAAINGTGAVLGPITGGLFASRPNLGWRWAFYFQLPIIGFAAVATYLALPSALGKHDRRLLREKARSIDYVGSVLFVAGTTLTLLGLHFIKPPQVPFTAAKVAAPFFVGLAMLAAFVYWELRPTTTYPIIPFHIFRTLAVDQIFLINFLFGYVFYATLYYVPQFYQVVDGQDAVQASLSLMPVVVTSIVLSWLTGLLTTLSARYKWSLVLGSALQLIGVALLFALFQPRIPRATAIAVMVCIGLGFGCQMQSSIVGVQAASSQRTLAIATSVRNFSRNIGGVLGIAISGIIVHVRFPHYVSQLTVFETIDLEIVEQVQQDPLLLHTLDASVLGAPIDVIIDVYARVLRDTFLVYLPLSALGFMTCALLHEYSLTRTHDGEPVRVEEGMCVMAWRRMTGGCPIIVKQQRRRSKEEEETSIAA